MDVSHLLSEIDAKIASLQTARSAILSINSDAPTTPVKGKRGRPKGSKNAAKSAPRKRNLTPEGRKRIADAMKRRWANERKAKEAPKKVAAKKEAAKK
jgi:hypothetical protein